VPEAYCRVAEAAQQPQGRSRWQDHPIPCRVQRCALNPARLCGESGLPRPEQTRLGHGAKQLPRFSKCPRAPYRRKYVQ